MARIIVAAALLLFGMGELTAQMTQEEVSIIQNLYGMEKRSIYREAMDLSPSDSVSFWPLYDEFENKRKELGLKRIQVMKGFAEKYPNISNDEINEVVETSNDIAEDLLELEMDYYEKIRDKSSASVAARFYQIERFISTAVNMYLMQNLPFIGEFNVKADKK